MSSEKQGEGFPLEDFRYFLKGDVSGIQEFIFNVKSKGAARALKGRSFFIQVLSLIGMEMVKQELAKDQVIHEFYNGGGDFYLFFKECSLEQLKELQARIDTFCQHQSFHLAHKTLPVHSQLEKKVGLIMYNVRSKTVRLNIRV